MQQVLVRSKLHRPPTSQSTIHRPHLVQHLQNGLDANVTLISAPAGFGKSTIVSEWLDQIESAPSMAEAGTKVSWLSLEEADNNLLRFARYLAAAIEDAYPQSCETLTSFLSETPSTTAEALTTVFANTVSLVPGRLVLVLDDLHLIADEAIYGLLSKLIQYNSKILHFVFITRVDPPLPLSRWRALGTLNELRLRNLCFTLEETELFLSRNLDTMPSAEIIMTLHERTEGWVVGLRLVALALRGASDYSGIVAGFEANSNRYIIDYLMDDVLEHQSPSMQQFLICTAILTRFSPTLCAAVAEMDEIVAQQHIDYLARSNLFLIELSSPAQWYRFHHQFQSMLLSRLHARYDQQAIAQLHRQAAFWLAENDQVDEAIRHLTAIPDLVAVGDLIERHWAVALNEHRFNDLEEWLSLVPGAQLNQRPILLIALAWVQDHRLEYSQCFASLQRAEELLQTHSTTIPEVTKHILWADIIALRISNDKSIQPSEAIDAIQQSWENIRPYLARTHCLTVVWLAHAMHRRSGNDLPLEMLTTALDRATEWPPMARCRLLYSAGILYWYKCHLSLAERVFQRGIHLARQHNQPLAIILCTFGLSLVASGRNQQELAESLHLAVVKEPHYQNGLRAVLSAYSLVKIYVARGELDTGRSMLESLKHHAMLMGRPYLFNQVAALEALLALGFGDLPAALRWALVESHSEMYSSSDRIPVVSAIILIAEGSQASLLGANRILQNLNRHHDEEHDWAFGIETGILEAVTWDKLGKMEQAISTLGKVAQFAVPNGLIGPFIEYAQDIRGLLDKMEKRSEYAPLIPLMQVISPGTNTSSPGHYDAPVTMTPLVMELVEPLTQRELEILRLLANRLSNKEIAHQLIVSTNTVRNHTANIFSKLQVENRYQAVERAQQVGLLPTS